MTQPHPANPAASSAETYTTIEAARLMGMAVRSVQMMVDRGELAAWKTAGGHRRIARESVARWLAARRADVHRGRDATAEVSSSRAGRREPSAARPPRVLLIEDSKHYQNLLRLLIEQKFPQVELHVADEGIAGLAMAGRLQPDVLIVDILLPGIDGPTLIATLRSQPQFAHSRLIVVTSLDEAQREPYSLALAGVPVVHKPRLVTELPPLLTASLAAAGPPDAQIAA